MRERNSQLLQREDKPVTSAVYVERARGWARKLEEGEAQRAGSLPAARAAVERRLRLPSGVLYSLRYRPPKQIAVDVYEGLRTALIAAHEREQQRLAHEIEVTRALGVGSDDNVVRAAQAALDKAAD